MSFNLALMIFGSAVILLIFKAISASMAYAIVIAVSLLILLGVEVYSSMRNETKYKFDLSDKALQLRILAAMAIGLVSAMITIRIIFS